MAQALTASMPQFTELGYNSFIAIEAIDPTTGAAVTGVTVSNVDIYADISEDPAVASSSGPGTAAQLLGPFILLPGPNA